ncbi:MAG TPA: hypothetical protein PK878_05725 [bacterium]|mgnify:FL=1|nr:hypothetical protein [bacterium]HOL96488.1 hypothetical protein [bacterium]HPP01382.1 hypothetical protein [bacterium]HXK92333.1 hypothetical protein [bacterium]
MMEPIRITHQSANEQGWMFTVVVGNENDRTEHKVTLEHLYYHKLTRGKTDPENLVKRSFEFLLRREPKSSIFRSFNIQVIKNYFPEFEREMLNTA